MADTLLIQLQWENSNAFKMTAKLNTEDAVTICEMEENGNLDVLWPHVKKIAVAYTSSEMDKIGDTMKA